MDVQVAFELRFKCFTYGWKDNEITLPMQLVSCQNSFEINGDHRNNILTVATANDDVSNACCYYGIAGLVSPRSSKLGLTNLKTKVH
jgi:hypothetical protein